MAVANKPRYVDVSTPALTVDCPHCGLRTARFLDHCRNCGYKLWPSSHMASAAFKAWQAADPVLRSELSRFDTEYPSHLEVVVDYEARAHQLGIHLSQPSRWPFVICFGSLFLALAAIPFSATIRIVFALIGALIFLWGIIGWVVVEDTEMFPSDSAEPEAHH